MTPPFRYYLRVRYIECDAQKVVFNSRYAEYVDVSITEFLRAAGIVDEFIHGGLDFQLVKQTVEWKAPARYDQVLELSVALGEVKVIDESLSYSRRNKSTPREDLTQPPQDGAVNFRWRLVGSGALGRLDHRERHADPLGRHAPEPV